MWSVSVERYSGLGGGMEKLLSLGCLGSSGLRDCLVAVALLTDAGGARGRSVVDPGLVAHVLRRVAGRG